MPSIAVKRKYEAIYILKPDSTDDQINATIQRYKKVVENAGGEVEKTGVWERRRLAYEIRGYNDGIFALLNFTGEATVEAELRRVFQISSGEDQIRYMIVKPEESEAGRPGPDVTETINRNPQPAPAPAPQPVAVVEAAAPADEAPVAAATEPEIVAEAPSASEASAVIEAPEVEAAAESAPVAAA